MSEARLYVGFGGSGLKTLAAFVKTMVAHRERSAELDTRFAFILVDTNKGDLETYTKQIRENCRQLGRDPIVLSVQTSQGITDLSSFVANKLNDAGHDQRLRDAWFYQGDTPFTAERFKGIPEDGAGQCPQVSSFLAWARMPELEASVNEAVEKLQIRGTLAEGTQDWMLRVHYVAGLAGGTGRGCWTHLAFKVRETLLKADIPCLPMGYFYDASVFGEIMAKDRAEANKMRVNALTGLSELAAWMRNDDAQDPYVFRLASLERPRDLESDVLNVERITKGRRGVKGESPVAQAFVVFGKGKAGSPSRPERYYQIVGNALYLRLVSEIAGGAVNGESFGGLGAASISIPILEIRDYVAQYVKKFLPEQFAASMESASAREWAGLLLAPVDFKGFSYGAKSDGKILERVLAGVLAVQAGRFNRLDGVLKNKKYKEAETLAKQIDDWAESTSGAVAIREIAKQLLVESFWGTQASPDSTGIGGLIRDFGMEFELSEEEYGRIYGSQDGSGVERSNPVARALALLVMRASLNATLSDGQVKSIDLSGFGAKQQLASELSRQLQQLAQSVPGVPTGLDAVGTRRANEALAQARKGLFSSKVDDAERAEIIDVAKARVRIRSMGAVQDEVRRTLYQAADELRSLANDLGTVVDELSTKAKNMTAELAASRDRLFWTDDDFKKALDDEGDGRFSAQMLADQRLEPVANDEALQEALLGAMRDSSNDSVERAAGEFVRGLRDWVESAATATDVGDRRRRLRRLIDRGVEDLSRDLLLPQGFYQRNFGFFATVRGLIAEWGRRLSERKGVEHEMTRLKDAFRIQFGIAYPFESDAPAELSGEELDQFAVRACRAMAVALGTRCDVLFEEEGGRQGVRESDVVRVVLPTEDRFDDRFASEADDDAKHGGQFRTLGSFKACVTFKKEAGGNPYAMFAYAQKNFPNWRDDAGLDRVTSLSYHKNPDTHRWMEACEDPSAWSYFEFNDDRLPHASGSFGLGFTFPVFVKDKKLKGLRWKPWLKHGETVTSARESFLYDALVYALMDEPEGDAGSSLMRVNKLEGWDQPVLRIKLPSDGKPGSWEFCRSAYRDNFGRRMPNHPAFKGGDNYSSVRKMIEALRGDGNPALEAIADEATVYFRDVLAAHPEDVDAAAAVLSLCRDVRARLEEARASQTGHTQKEYQELYGQLIARVDELGKKSPEALAEHFRRRGRP
jgi:Tubulin like